MRQARNAPNAPMKHPATADPGLVPARLRLTGRGASPINRRPSAGRSKMEPDRDGGSADGNSLSGQDRRALGILERSTAKSGLGLLWARTRCQLLVVWGARLAILTGLIVCLARWVRSRAP
jgi:hypothetical protein